MRVFFVMILSVLTISLFAQQPSFRISVQKQILSAHVDADNANKKIVINTGEKIANVQRFMIRSLYPELDKDFKRTFSIVGDNEESVFTFSDDKENGVFLLPLKEVADKLNKSKTYKLYTVAIPKDPEAAAAVRVRRILLANIEVQ